MFSHIYRVIRGKASNLRIWSIKEKAQHRNTRKLKLTERIITYSVRRPRKVQVEVELRMKNRWKTHDFFKFFIFL